MAYERGNKPLPVELARVQSWVEQADADLYGRNGEAGVIREHRDSQSRNRAIIVLCGVFGGAIPTILAVMQALHLIGR